MTQKRSLGLLRFFEQLSLLSFLAGLLYVVWWLMGNGELVSDRIAIAGGICLFGFVLYVYTHNKINTKIDIITAHNDFSLSTQFLALFERSPVPYVGIDRNGRITKINQSGVNLLQAQADTVVGTSLTNRFSSTEEIDVSVIVNKIKAGVTVNDIELQMSIETGEKLWVLLSSYTSQEKDQSFVSLVDITQAKKVDTAKSEFLALATHQLGTPIAAIRWNTELLIKHIPESAMAATEKYFRKIQVNTNRMTTLIDDFLNVSKLELGTFATAPKAIQMTNFLNEVVDEFHQRLEQKQITLERSEEPVNFSLTTDARLLHIIVSNLMSNAAKYVKEKGTIWLTTSVANNKFTLQIADNGIGIPERELEKLFKKFYRASNATKHQAEGTGLGLYVVNQAVELLGGTVEVASDSDKGATFIVTLPLTQ